MNSLDTQYQDLLQAILDYGVEKKDRTGTGTKSIFGYTFRHKMSWGFPLLTTNADGVARAIDVIVSCTTYLYMSVGVMRD